MKLKIHYIICLFALTAVTFSGCEFGEIKQKTTSGEMSITVDENLQPLTDKLTSDFQRLNKEAKINPIFKPTKNVVTDLINKETRLIIIAGDISTEDKKFIQDYKIEMQRYEVGIDGIAFIVNPSNPVLRLTSDDLKNIFTGKITQWSQVKSQDEEQNKNVISKLKGTADKIKLFIQRPNSGTYSYVKDSVLSGQNYFEKAQICSTSTQIMDMVKENDNGIGIVNMCWVSKGNQDLLDTTVHYIRVSKIWSNGKQDDFTQFHQGLIYTRQYPYTRKVIIYTTDAGMQLSMGFIHYMVSNDGQKVILDNGLVPINQPIRTIKIDD